MRTYRIRVKDLVLMCSIGVYAHEKTKRQRVRINLEMTVQESVTPLDDDIANVVSYDTIIDSIRSLVESGHINLVETLADAIADICLADRRVEAVRLSVEKLDVFRETDGVGVEIERSRGRA
ncbi:dihydroneopterin aldolase [Azospirillum halopraeferens]|uniref:dihydroneopterin aldolase n=1 Tax=Azospirillum halopraeferens TaxID=34010 RepID=UPI001FE005B9|nr:dihydroneopterin aldolase [Azospirillum halopraeferens]